MAGMYPDNSTESIFGDAVRWPGVDEETGKFTNGDFSDPLKPPSFIPAETVNLILDNLANLISALGGEPDNFSVGQLRDAVLARFDAASQSVEQGDADALAAAKAHADEAAARRQGDADTLAQAGQLVLDAQLATNTWLPSAETAADLPAASELDAAKNYLCKVLSDPDIDSNIVWQMAAGEAQWSPFASIAFLPPATETERGGVRVRQGNGFAIEGGDRLGMSLATPQSAGAMSADDKASLDAAAASLPESSHVLRRFFAHASTPGTSPRVDVAMEQRFAFDFGARLQSLPLGPLSHLEWPLQLASSDPADVAYDVVEHEGRRAIRVGAIRDWAGVDVLLDWPDPRQAAIDFRAGDRLNVRVYCEQANQMLLNTDNSGWRDLVNAGISAGTHAWLNSRAFTQEDIDAIAANSPRGIRIRGNTSNAAFVVTDIEHVPFAEAARLDQGIRSLVEEDRRLSERIDALGEGSGGGNHTFAIGSDAALAAWADNVPGNDYSRVLIKAGTWTLARTIAGGTITNPVKIIDCTAIGTLSVVGEAGSLLELSNTSNCAGISDSGRECEFFGVKVNCTGIDTGVARNIGFWDCSNLANCTGIGTGVGSATNVGFWNCSNLVSCTGKGLRRTGSGSAISSGFWACSNLVNCTGTSDAAFTSFGFWDCSNLTNCIGAGSATTTGVGFQNSSNLSNCIGFGTASNHNAGDGYGFEHCRTGFGNRNGPTPSRTSTFRNCLMAQGAATPTANDWANTAAGGWNLP